MLKKIRKEKTRWQKNEVDKLVNKNHRLLFTKFLEPFDTCEKLGSFL